LLNYFKSLPKDVNRSLYTVRILDILKNVKKQKAEINKILVDTRTLMKEIALVSQTLQRSFAVTDEKMYADAKKDETIKNTYKDFVAMDKSFSKLVEQIEQTGQTQNDILELDVKIQHMSESVTTLNSERLSTDLEEMKKENAKLTKQLQGGKK